MAIATMTSKGQVTLPKEIRDKLGLKPGDKLEFGMNDVGDIRLRRVKVNRLEDLIGMIEYDGPPLTQKDIDDAIAEAVMGRDERSKRR